MKRWLSLFLIFIMCVCVGCGQQMPEMTEEDEAAITEYAVGMLLKHSKEGNNRIEELEEEENGEEEIVEEPISAPEIVEEIPEEPVPENPDVLPEQPDDNDTPNNIEEPQYSMTTIDEFLGLDGIRISYDGYEIMDEYQPGENTYFSISATKGKKLVVLRFIIENVSSDIKKVDMNQYDVSYSFGQGFDKKKKIDHTMTAKDLYSYQAYMDPGATDLLIGIAELVEADLPGITEPALMMSLGGQSVTVLLQ